MNPQASQIGENMNEEMMQQLSATAERLATAAEALDRVLGRLDAQQDALNAKVDRIVAAVEEKPAQETDATSAEQLLERLADLEKTNADLKAQTARLTRKTLPPIVSALLSKSMAETDERFEPGALDKALESLTVEQRIAVKAEMARAGILE
jgi:predicted RNase H-like nuclease (RuvC/YqgF family)